MLVDRGENKITTFKLITYEFAAAHLDTSYCCFIGGDANIKKCPERKRTHASTAWSSTCTSWTKTDIPSRGRFAARELVFPFARKMLRK
jgi:hypothetical protein